MDLVKAEWQTRTPGWDYYYNDMHASSMSRARQRTEIPWILDKIRRHIGYRARILDLGCGYGYVTNQLARKGHEMTGLDKDGHAVMVARLWDSTQSVSYIAGDIHSLPFSNNSFDVILALEVLPHTEKYADIFQEARRVLKPGGIIIFNGFNRTLGRWLFKPAGGGRWIKPKWLVKQVKRSGLEPVELCGLIPTPFQKAFWKFLFKHAVSDEFRFRLCAHCWCGYIGLARKRKFH